MIITRPTRHRGDNRSIASRTTTAVHKISWLEDAVWKAIATGRGRDIRLTRDWLDLSVEHLSKWWRTTKVDKYDASYWRLIINLFQYVGRTSFHRRERIGDRHNDNIDTNPWAETIAVVAYVPVSNPNATRMQPIDILVLGAQVASLMRNRVGRIVVVTDQVYTEYMQTHIWPYLVQLLQSDNPSTASKNATHWVQDLMQGPFLSPLPTNDEITIGSTELITVDVASENTFLGKTTKLVPRAGLILLYEALFQNSTTTSKEVKVNLVLGPNGRDRWKYIYYTEQDSPLYTPVTAFPDFKTALDGGAVLTPHRLFPVPHESDFISGSLARDLPQNRFLPAIGNWTRVTILDARHHSASCCDKGINSRDGKLLYPKGNNFWYLNGFAQSLPEGKSPHETNQVIAKHLERFSTYQLVRLKYGTGLTLVAGSESSRQCAPRPKSPHGCPVLQEIETVER